MGNFFRFFDYLLAISYVNPYKSVAIFFLPKLYNNSGSAIEQLNIWIRSSNDKQQNVWTRSSNEHKAEYMNQKFKWIIWNKLLLFSSWSSYKLVWTKSSKYDFICKGKQTKYQLLILQSKQMSHLNNLILQMNLKCTWSVVD